MDTKSIIAEIKNGLGEDYEKNIAYLGKKIEEYKSHEKVEEIMQTIDVLMLEQLPPEKKEYFDNVLCIDGVRLDVLYKRVITLMRTGNLAAAYQTICPLTDHILKHFWETEDVVYFTFENPFQHQLAGQLFRTSKTVKLAPLNFSDMFVIRGYLAIEMKHIDEAIDALEKAIAFNPINVSAYFELAEAYKLQKNMEMLLFTIKDTLKVAYTKEIIARCYCNLGYYCIEIGEHQDAIHFLIHSLTYYQNPKVTSELEHIVKTTGKEIGVPLFADITETFQKYNQEIGPNGIVINVAETMGKKFLENNHNEMAKYCYGIVVNLTGNEESKKIYDSI
ncbi:MAG: tetratricopeptide repeat protein [Oscillospiraceae bacterium]|jgi:tetratricopeptide (TPR) repeat protein|nr:tetratricopeptide repeat protein [Oscillospiraceae bacterium]